MSDRRRRPFNPLDLDPEDFDRLYDEDSTVSLEDLEESDSEYDYLSGGARRRKPQINSEF
jgi:hypothetical protein